jgi:hypothetical protein
MTVTQNFISTVVPAPGMGVSVVFDKLLLGGYLVILTFFVYG